MPARMRLFYLFAVVLFLVIFQKEFMLVSFDREMAVTLKKNVLWWDALLFLLIVTRGQSRSARDDNKLFIAPNRATSWRRSRLRRIRRRQLAWS